MGEYRGVEGREGETRRARRGGKKWRKVEEKRGGEKTENERG